ncbi:hypothetical protein [Paraflavitalea sp. CAU 1676]|uniref:hypothetical protein n=1 Tax=Paraflavitalea sp. CAU 1676 TaxID=3032598 RepID=UPI0023DAE09E|nr:hypothetical protein [Paraflavitalea sp. CAU 1676]MDF2190028.1 hypothetical protein [Paraflavitalea sp. CAU 1676]
MEAYIKHLLTDILEAERPDQPVLQYAYPEFIDDSQEEDDRWPDADPVHSFGYYCGLQQEQFPPAHMLSTPQLERLCAAFSKMMFTWNLDTDIPDDIPTPKKYQLLVSTLDIKTEINDSSLTTFELCSFDPPSCPMGEYCTCKQFLQDDALENIDDYQHGE